MKKLLPVSLCAVALFACTQAKGQLGEGDLAFTAYNTAGATPLQDSFSFVLLKDITGGTEIRFTDRGMITTGIWSNAGSLDGTIAWTAGSDLPVGTEVLITNLQARVSGVVNGTISIVSGFSAAGISLTDGDQLIAFRGSDDINTADELISGIHWNRCLSGGTLLTNDDDWDPSSCTGGSNSSISRLPLFLTPYRTAMVVPEAPGGLAPIQASFNGDGLPELNLTSLRQTVYTPWDWDVSNSATGELPTPTGFTYYGTPLPVTLRSFTGYSSNADNILKWETASERNLAQFIVERSANGVDYTAIHQTDARNAAAQYRFTDHSAPEAAYYRLQYADADGTTGYSRVLELSNPQGSRAFSFTLHPNPVDHLVHVSVNGTTHDRGTIELTDVAGRVMGHYTMHSDMMQVDMSSFGAGIYFLSYTDGVNTKTIRMSKQ